MASKVGLVVVLAALIAACLAEADQERAKRATTVWSLSSIPNHSDPDDILKVFAPMHRQYGDDSIGTSTKHSSASALRIFYAQGSYSGNHAHKGAGFYSTPSSIPSDADAMILKYDIYFENFGFGNGGKLPGLFGGESGDGAYACSGGHIEPGCFSLRLMWRKNGDGEVYAYIPRNQASGFDDRDDVITNYDYGHSLGRGRFQWQNGQWHTVTQEAHLNEVGKTNGWVKTCVKASGSSEQCYTANNLLMRNVNSHYLRGLMFSTFFGGGSAKYAAPNDCYTYFKNFEISVPTYSPLVVG